MHFAAAGDVVEGLAAGVAPAERTHRLQPPVPVDTRPHLGLLGREVEAPHDLVLALGPPRDAAPGEHRGRREHDTLQRGPTGRGPGRVRVLRMEDGQAAEQPALGAPGAVRVAVKDMQWRDRSPADARPPCERAAVDRLLGGEGERRPDLDAPSHRQAHAAPERGAIRDRVGEEALHRLVEVADERMIESGTVGHARQHDAQSGWHDPRRGYLADPCPVRGTHRLGAEPRDPAPRVPADETGGAAVLLAATVAALVWVNVDASSYESVGAHALDPVGGTGIELDLREWVNSGLMTFFFFVVGLEARRELDLGELRERRRFALPMVAASAAWRRGRHLPRLQRGPTSAQGWGVAMSTDTAFALGLLALVGPRFPQRLRAYLLTIAVVDDVSRCGDRDRLHRGGRASRRCWSPPGCSASCWPCGRPACGGPRLPGAGDGDLAGAARVGRRARRRRPRHGPADVRVHGRAPRPRARRGALPRVPRATDARARAVRGRGRQGGDLAERPAAAALPPVDQLLIVPLFALANAGIAIDSAFLERASPLRSRSASWSATSSASRPASSAPRGCLRG